MKYERNSKYEILNTKSEPVGDKSNRGYTLLFAVITASVVLGVAVFILSVSKKQYALAVAARDSLYSLYAADSGLECAVASSALSATSTSLTLTCNGAASLPTSAAFVSISNAQTAAVTTGMGLTGTAYQAGPIRFLLPGNSCASILVTDGYDSTGAHKTLIDSRGYNFCDTSTYTPQISSRTVERALRLTLR